MKRLIAAFIMILITGALSAQEKDTVASGYYPTLSTPVQIGRELPRTRTIVYNTEQGSIQRVKESSTYYQSLTGSWIESRTPEGARTFGRKFTLPFAWVDRELFLHIGFIQDAYEIYINGQFAAYNQNGTSSSEFDITKFAEEGANTIEILIYADYAASKLVSRENSSKGDVMDDIYIISQPRVRIRDYVASCNFEEGDATVQLGVVVKSHLINEKQYRLFYKLLDPDGNEASSGHKDFVLSDRAEDTVTFFMNIRNAKPWSHETPNLYTLLLKTQHEGRFPEYISYKMGLRKVEMIRGKLAVNYRETPYSVAEFSFRGDSLETAGKLSQLKEGGYNMVKVEGFPQPEYFYDICDYLGLYVSNQADINSSRFGNSRTRDGNPSNDTIWSDSYSDRAKTMYYTSRNHPSVIMFSLAEESSNGYNLYESYLALKKVERVKPIVYMNAGGEWNSDAVNSELKDEHPEAVAERITFDICHNGAVVKDLVIDLVLSDPVSGLYLIKNNALLTEFRGNLVYTVKQGVKKVSEGKIPVVVGPQESIQVKIPLEGIKAGKALKYEADLESL